MIEKEFKYLITKEEFYIFVKKLEKLKYNNKKEVLQTNYYYDNDNCFLHKNNCTLRVREKKNKLSQQLKVRKEDGNGCVVSSETKTEIQNMPYAISSKRIKMHEVNCEFKLLGSLVTNRTRYVFDGFSVDCDVSSYFGFKYYEIEIEYSGEPPEYVLELFKYNTLNCISKYTRFLMRCKNEKENQN